MIVVGVRFKPVGKIYYFDPAELPVEKGSHVVVETSRGTEYGTVVIGKRDISEDEVVQPLKKVSRIATEQDEERYAANKEKEKEALDICHEKIRKHNLPMRLIDVEITFDNSKIIFYFTADNRIDFRELVKDLASIFKTRIELRQIGVRDQVRRIGGNGVCGRELCCCTFLNNFDTVSIKMAKEQNIALNPAKISGNCGRLMCCLKYEQEAYEEKLNKLPKVGAIVKTEDGEGTVDNVEILKEIVRVKIRDEEDTFYKKYPASEVKIIKNIESKELNKEEQENLKELEKLEKLDKMENAASEDDI